METAASMSDPVQGRSYVIEGLEALRESMRIPASSRRKCDGKGIKPTIIPECSGII